VNLNYSAGGSDDKTKLLIHGEEQMNGIYFNSSEPSPSKNVTKLGGALQSLNRSRFGGKSWYFDGVDDYLTIPDSDDWDFGSGNFTIDFWIYKLSRDGDYNFVAAHMDDSSSAWYLSSGIDSGNMEFYDYTATTNCRLYSGSALPLNQWVHVALVRNVTTISMYFNGQLTNAAACTGSLSTGTSTLGVGARSSGVNYINAYIDELRISKGIARWTSNFDPPDRPYG
jgi:hypothetical protein